jgi:hypothetical protein
MFDLITVIVSYLLILLGTLNVLQGAGIFFIAKHVTANQCVTSAGQTIIALLLIFAGFYIAHW